jgi:hypothetical protein
MQRSQGWMTEGTHPWKYTQALQASSSFFLCPQKWHADLPYSIFIFINKSGHLGLNGPTGLSHYQLVPIAPDFAGGGGLCLFVTRSMLLRWTAIKQMGTDYNDLDWPSSSSFFQVSPWESSEKHNLKTTLLLLSKGSKTPDIHMPLSHLLNSFFGV